MMRYTNPRLYFTLHMHWTVSFLAPSFMNMFSEVQCCAILMSTFEFIKQSMQDRMNCIMYFHIVSNHVSCFLSTQLNSTIATRR